MRLPYDARAAREAAGLTVEQAAKRARICPRYLLSVERNGAPYVLALRLAAIYQAPIDCFIFRASGRPKPGGRSLPRKQGSRPESQPAGSSRRNRKSS